METKTGADTAKLLRLLVHIVPELKEVVVTAEPAHSGNGALNKNMAQISPGAVGTTETVVTEMRPEALCQVSTARASEKKRSPLVAGYSNQPGRMNMGGPRFPQNAVDYLVEERHRL